MTATKAKKTAAAQKAGGFVISSRGELAAALEVLARIEAQEARVKAEMDAAIARAKQPFEQRLYFEFAGERVPCDTARALIRGAAAVYAAKHPEDVFRSGGKTEKFTHGEISARTVPACVSFAEGEAKSSVVKRLTEKTGILKKLPEWLKNLPLWRKRNAGQLLKLSVDLVSCTEIKKQLDAGELDAKDLEQAGFVLVDARESISVKAYEHVVTAEAA